MTKLGEHSDLTDTEIRIVVKMAVREMFEEMGHDLSTPAGREAARKDFAYNRNSRLNSERISNWIMSATITVFIGGVAYALIQGIKAAFTAKGLGP